MTPLDRPPYPTTKDVVITVAFVAAANPIAVGTALVVAPALAAAMWLDIVVGSALAVVKP